MDDLTGQQSEAVSRRRRLAVILVVAGLLVSGGTALGWWSKQRDTAQAAGIEERVESELLNRWTFEELWDLRAVSLVEEWSQDRGNEPGPPALIDAFTTTGDTPTWVGFHNNQFTVHYRAGEKCVVLGWNPDQATVTTVDERCERTGRYFSS